MVRREDFTLSAIVVNEMNVKMLSANSVLLFKTFPGSPIEIPAGPFAFLNDDFAITTLRDF